MKKLSDTAIWITDKIKCYVVLLLMSAIAFVQFELSCNQGPVRHILMIDLKYILLGIFSIYCIYLMVDLIPKFSWIFCAIVNLATTAISIINFWAIKYHGMPLTPSDIKNVRTALNVLNTYSFALERSIFEILICFIFLIALNEIYRRCVLNSNGGKWIFAKKIAFAVVFILIIAFKGYIAENSIKPRKTIVWSWEEAYYKYGYIPCTVEAFYSCINAVEKPKGYSYKTAEEKFNSISNEERSVGPYPDIIVILNESLYDMDLVIDTNTDVPALEYINQVRDNYGGGYAVVTSNGGGTNSSEYELLTSNSLQLMQGITPFNQLNMKGAYSVVSELKQNGYYTIAMHPAPGLNYSRITGYSGLGFDEVYFEEGFSERSFFYNRWYETDASAYRNAERRYENALSNGKPIFLYLLTMQNHGGWDANDPEVDTVHTLNDFGDYTEEMNEYLSCIKESDKAFQELIEYYEKVDREVIIVMVGDHSPSILDNIVDANNYPYEEYRLKMRSTPMIIWSNYGLEFGDMGVMSINYLMPEILSRAGIPTSNYYQYLNQLMDKAPILTSYGKWYDSSNNIHSYEEAPEEIKDYFILEYYNIKDR